MVWKPVNQGLITTIKDQWKFSKIKLYNQAIVKKTKYFHLSNQNTGKPLDLFQSSLQQERMARDFEI